MSPEIFFNSLWYNQLVSTSDEKEIIVNNIKTIISQSACESCLEIGMGTSTYFSDELSPRFNDYTIVEKNAPAVLLKKGVTLVEEDWERFPLTRQYDVVIASHVVYYFWNRKQAVEKMLQALSSQGTLIIVVNSPDSDYGNLKKYFFRQIGRPYQFTYNVLADILENHHVLEFTLPTGISFTDYHSLHESLSLSFDQYQYDYHKMKPDIMQFLAHTVQGNIFTINQKMIVLENTQRSWKYLIHHPDYIVNFSGMKLWVKDGVFTPDRQVTYSSSLVLHNLPDVSDKTILDMGCGTGVIALHCALHHAYRVVAADYSKAAVQNALTNVQLNGMTDTIEVVHSNLFERIEGKFHIIFANLPILDEVWEPEFSAIGTLAAFLAESKDYLYPDGRVYFSWASFAPVQPVLDLLEAYQFRKIVVMRNNIEWTLFEVMF